MANATIEITKSPVRALFEDPSVQQRFQNILGKKAAGFIVSVINVVTNDKTLMNTDRNSILFAAATAATLDLPINPNLGFAYIIPYKDKAQFQMGYKGFIQLAQRSGQFKTINAIDVREGEIKSHNRLTGEIEFNWIEDQTARLKLPVVGFVGYFSLLNGFEKTLYLTTDQLKEHGLKYSQSYKSKQSWVRDSSLWNTDFESMAQKTVIKLLLSKYAPLSIEMQKAVISDQAVVRDWEGQNFDYIDNKLEAVTLESIQAAYEDKKVLLTPTEIKDATRIIDNKEEKSYAKLFKFLNEKNGNDDKPE